MMRERIRRTTHTVQTKKEENKKKGIDFCVYPSIQNVYSQRRETLAQSPSCL